MITRALLWSKCIIMPFNIVDELAFVRQIEGIYDFLIDITNDIS